MENLFDSSRKVLQASHVGIECDSTIPSINSVKQNAKSSFPAFSAQPQGNHAKGKKPLAPPRKRSALAVLQHGSIPLTEAYRRLPDYTPSRGTTKIQKNTSVEKRLV